MRVRTAQALIGLTCAAFVALVGRLAYIQTKMAPELNDWAERRQTGTIPLPGIRGTVMDRKHRVVAGSQIRFVVYADPRVVGDHAEVAQTLGEMLNTPADQIRNLLDHPPSPAYVVLKRGVDEETELKAIRTMETPIPGLGVQREPSRVYAMEGLASYVIGFVGSDGKGLEGIELSCEKYLHDKPGKRSVFFDARRRAMFEAPDSYVAPQDGMHVILTIDSAIQLTVERALKDGVDRVQAESGVAIVMNPKTGEVLALTCYPTFEPATAGQVKPEVRRNRILTDPVEPGSVFKPFVMAAALTAGVTNPSEVINCHGGLYVIGKRMLHDSHPYGNLTVTEILAKSSNIGMAILGQRLGNKKMYDYLAALGFGKKTGIDLRGEGNGLFMPLKAWTSYTTTSVPMGHELAVTPIQIITAFSALVNGGMLLTPRVVAAVVDQEGNVVEDHTKVIEKGQVVEPHVASQIRDMLIAVVNEGTGKSCQLDRYQVMGKTGTAQVPRKDKHGYEDGAYLSSFVAAVPASDPQLACLVMIRKPNKKIAYYGSAVSAPVVKAIFEQTLAYMNVPPERDPPTKAKLVRGD